MKYGNRLREVIKDSGYKQAELAEKIGVSRSTISFWINAEYPPLDGIEKVCNELKIPLHSFFVTNENAKNCDNCRYLKVLKILTCDLQRVTDNYIELVEGVIK